MQNLTKIIQSARKSGAGDNAILNIVREYLQVLILKAIYQSKYGRGLSFLGGTCLRICYGLKRYSEDLDFALDRKIPDYSFKELNETISGFLRNTDFEADVKADDSKIVQKSFIRVNKILHLFGISPLKDQKLHVKLEIDTNPVNVPDKKIETFFVSKFNEMFPILKHTEDTLFAGKIGAVLNRAYTKGRDFYDLIWYLNRKKEINFDYLNLSMKQSGLRLRFKNNAEVMKALEEKISKTDINKILFDIGRFLEDDTECEWIKNYPAAFKQASERFLGNI